MQMRNRALVLLSVLAELGTLPAHGQPRLSAQDYDRFYDDVVLKARNGNREEWLASYQAVTSFVAAVRREVEQLPDPTKRALAQAVHDNGYWKSQEIRIRDATDPFLGARLVGSDEQLKAVLTPRGYDAYRDRYAQGSRGYRFTLEVVADRAAFYGLQGKDIPRLEELPVNTVIVNANAQSWDDLVAEAGSYPAPAERLGVIVGNQLNAVASALSLMRGTKTLSDAEMDYATTVIWRYTGHFSGTDGWDREPLVRTPYEQLPEAERAKDRPVWKAVRDALASLPAAESPQSLSTPVRTAHQPIEAPCN
jgi:hypothetical protein